MIAKYSLLLILLTNTSHAASLIDEANKKLNISEKIVNTEKFSTSTKNYITFRGNTIGTSSEEPTKSEIGLSKEYWRLGYEKQKQKKHAEAIPKFIKALEHDANNPKIWHAYGWSLSELDSNDQAITAFTISLVLENKQDDEAWSYLKWVHHKNNKLAKLRECYIEANISNSNNKKLTQSLLNPSINYNKKKTKDGENYTIQVGAYSNIKNAQKRLSEVKKEHNEVEVISANNKHYVILGNFSTRQEAINKKRSLKSKNSKGFYVKKL